MNNLERIILRLFLCINYKNIAKILRHGELQYLFFMNILRCKRALNYNFEITNKISDFLPCQLTASTVAEKERETCKNH